MEHTLLSLPDAVLEQVLLALPLPERAACMLVCKQTAAVGRLSRLLWRCAEVIDPASLLQALEVNPQLHVEHLWWKGDYCNWSEAEDATDEQSTADPDGPSAAQKLTRAAGLLGHSLIHLDIELDEEELARLTVGSWVQPLQRLRQLRLTQGHVVLKPHVGSLPHLEVARLYCNTLQLEPGCLPSCLTHLSTACSVTPVNLLEYAVPAAATLQQLEMDLFVFSGGAEQLDWRALSCLTALTCIELNAMLEEGAAPLLLPQELSALSRLQELSLEGDVCCEDAAFAPLAGLPALASLSLDANRLGVLPAAVGKLPALRSLYLGYQAQLMQLPSSGSAARWVRRVRTLNVPVQVALRSAPLLGAACQLRHLGLEQWWMGHLEPVGHSEQVMELLRQLEEMPRLRKVSGRGLAQAVRCSIQAVFRYGSLVRERPDVDFV